MIDLKIIMERNPRGFTSRSQLASLLRDLFPNDKKEVNLALTVYDSGITAKIYNLKYIDSHQMKIFISQLVDDYSLQEQYALLGIEIWAKAYKITIDKSNIQMISTQQSQPQNIQSQTKYDPSAYAQAGVAVYGDASEYEIINNGNGYVISKFRGFEKKNTIVPNTIDGKRIIGIGKCAYANCNEIEQLEITDGIEFIEDGAFAKCKNIKEIIFPNTLLRIGSEDTEEDVLGAFENCGMYTLLLPDSISVIGKAAFCNCKRLYKVHFSEKIKVIGEAAFHGCTKINEIQFPSSLMLIKQNAFACCFSLYSIIFNEGLKTIENNAFISCNHLCKVLMSSTISEIDNIYYSDNKNIFSVVYYNSSNYSMVSNPNLTIYCYAGSYALKYARKHGYPVRDARDFY